MSYEQQRKTLVDNLISEGYIKSKPVKEAFLTLPREAFLPPDQQPYAYVDTPLQIGQGQTISAPHMIAIMCEALDLHPGQHVLEIGTGSGYHAAIVATIIKPTGHIYTIERHHHLAQTAQENLNRTHITNATVETGDGSKGLPEHQPYDRIYVTAAAPHTPPPLIKELKEDGKLLVPVGDMYCDLILTEKQHGTTQSKSLGGCVFVPLVGKYGF
jgi:protein-L-isoaspartate(D-aspartate) O-methyltransferase